MIDIETDVFDAVYPFVSVLVEPGEFVNVYDPSPAALPHAYLAEMDNYPDRRTADSGGKENSCIVVYEAQVYSRSKTECKTIAAAMDSGMVGRLGFTKLQGQMIQNPDDITIFRYVARYERGVDRNGNLYKPT